MKWNTCLLSFLKQWFLRLSNGCCRHLCLMLWIFPVGVLRVDISWFLVRQYHKNNINALIASSSRIPYTDKSALITGPRKKLSNIFMHVYHHDLGSRKCLQLITNYFRCFLQTRNDLLFYFDSFIKIELLRSIKWNWPVILASWH